MKTVSAGGVVVHKDLVLLLQKFSGDFVLPKGRIESGESVAQAAIREVQEESGVSAKIEYYLGTISYTYVNFRLDYNVNKIVHWYLMKPNNLKTRPQKQEGFCQASFYNIDEAVKMIKHDAERSIIKKAIKLRNR